MGFMEMFVHTLIQNGHACNYPFQNEASKWQFHIVV